MEEKEGMFENAENQDGFYLGDLIKLDVFAVDFWKGIKKLWWLAVLIITALSLFAFYNCKKNYVPQYMAQASFSISTIGSSTGASGASSYSSYYNSALAEQLSKTFGYIINSATMKQILIEQLGVSGLNGTISASNDVANAPLFTITVTSTSPEDAYNILCAVIENYPRLAQYVLGETSMSIYSPAQYPEKPYNDFSYKKSVTIATLVGVFVSCLIFALYAVSKKTVRKKDDIKELLNQKCIGEIPWVDVKKRSARSAGFITISERNADFSESFRYLKRRVVKRLDEDEKKVLAVTSSFPGEGKTTVSYNLALAIANSGKKVAVVDADFTRKSIQKCFDANFLRFGITDYINGDCAVEDLPVENETENLHIFFAGKKDIKKIPNVPLFSLFDYLRKSYDYIVVDVPPCGIVSDAAQIINLSDKTLFVIKQDYVPISKIFRSLRYIYDLNASVIGVAFNAVKTGFSGYKGNYYSYGYSGKYGYYGKRYGYYGKRYGYYGKRYGYSGKSGYGYGGYDSKKSSGRGYGYGSHDYGYGYSSGGTRVTENITEKREK